MAKAPADLRSLARAHTELGIQTLAGIARNSTSDTARVQAVGMLLDRGWGQGPAAAHRRGRQRHPSNNQEHHREQVMIDIVLAAQRLDPAAAQRPPARVAAASALLDRGWGKLPAF
jgi:hypothetical protein